MDLSLMLVVIGVMTCPFAKHPCGAPKGDGILLSAFLWDGMLGRCGLKSFLSAWKSAKADSVISP